MADAALLMRQTARLDRLENRHYSALAKAYHSSRRRYKDNLSEVFTGKIWGRKETMASMPYTAAMTSDLSESLNTVFALHQHKIHESALADATEIIKSREKNKAASKFIAFESAARKELADEARAFMYRQATSRFANQMGEFSQSEIVSTMMAKKTHTQIISSVSGSKLSVFTRNEFRLNLLGRMERNRIYNSAMERILLAANDTLGAPGDDDPLMKMAEEVIDSRNHAFSRVLHGRLAPVGGEWEVPIHMVAKQATLMRSGMKGILWRTEGKHFVGGAYPAHFGERGRQVPWRRSWGVP